MGLKLRAAPIAFHGDELTPTHNVALLLAGSRVFGSSCYSSADSGDRREETHFPSDCVGDSDSYGNWRGHIAFLFVAPHPPLLARIVTGVTSRSTRYV